MFTWFFYATAGLLHSLQLDMCILMRIHRVISCYPLRLPSMTFNYVLWHADSHLYISSASSRMEQLV